MAIDGITRATDPDTGLIKYVDSLLQDITPDQIRNDPVGKDACGDVQEVMLNAIATRVLVNRTLPIFDNVLVWSGTGGGAWAEPVADWDGTTGTDNGPSFDAIQNAAFALPGHTAIMLPPGRYWLGTTSGRIAKATSQVSIVQVGDGELAGSPASGWVLAYVGERTSDTERPAITLNGDHLRTSRLGQDGFTRYNGPTSFTFNEDPNCNVGDELQTTYPSSETWWTGWGSTTYHMGTVVDVSGNTVTIGEPSLFDWFNADSFFVRSYSGPVNMYNVKVVNYRDGVDDVECVRFFRVSGGRIDGCHFKHNNWSTTIRKDCVLISDGRGWKITNSKLENCRYALPMNYCHDNVVRDCEVNYSRHGVEPFACYNIVVQRMYGHNNASLVDGHGSIWCHFHDISDVGAYAGSNTKNDLFNFRNLGGSLKRVYWDGYADEPLDNKNVYMGIHSGTLLTKYKNLLRMFPLEIEAVTFNSRTEELTGLPLKTHIGQAGKVIIRGWQLSGSDELLLGKVGTGIEQIVGLDTVSGYDFINYGAVGGSDPDLERYAGTATASTTTEVTLEDTDAGRGTTDDIHNGSSITLTSGPAADESSIIQDYDATTRVATVSPAFSTSPGTPDYEINVTNLRPGDLNKASAPHRGIDEKLLTPDAVAADTNLYPYRIRIWPIAVANSATRYEAVRFTLRALTHSSDTPGRHLWAWDFYFKSTDQKKMTGPVPVGREQGRFDMTATIPDDEVDFSPFGGVSAFEFTLNVTSDRTQTALWAEAEVIGAA